MKKILLLILLIAIPVALLIMRFTGCDYKLINKITGNTENTITLPTDDSLYVWKNKDSLNMARIQQANLTNEGLVSDLGKINAKYAELQKAYEKTKSELRKKEEVINFMVLSNQTKVNGTFQIPSLKDTLTSDYEDMANLNGCPFWGLNIEDSTKWYDFNLSFPDSGDVVDWSLDYDFTLRNKFNITQTKERVGGLFNKNTVYSILVENLNPFTSTDDINTFKITPKRNKFTFGATLSYGVDSDLKLKPNLGFGLMYKFFEF